MNPVVIVPTYISSQRSVRQGSVIATYDHMTPLNEKGELPRLLQSLKCVEGLGTIIILVASDSSIESRAAKKVLSCTADFPELHTVVIGAPELSLVRQRMEQLGIARLSKEVGLSGYSAIRNFGLVLANVIGYDAVVFLDDDELVSDPEFLKKGIYGLGKLTKKGIPILAKTGYYFNSDGNYYSKNQKKWYNHFWQQGKAFNQWIEHAMKGPRLSRSNHVCGGCLALHKEAFKRLAFDPWIPRGEDLDYMLNLRMYGSDIWFDNQWCLTHLPPASSNEGTRFRQDIYRWLYEFRKMEYSRTQIDLLQVKPSSLEPYPGPFLQPGITKRIKRTATLRSLARPNKRAYRQAAKMATGEASVYAEDNCANYYTFQFTWPEMMARLEGDANLQRAIASSVDLRRRESAHINETGEPSSSVRLEDIAALAQESQSLRAAEKPDEQASSEVFETSSEQSVDAGSTGDIHLNIAD